MSSPGKQQNEETYEVERVIDISWPEEVGRGIIFQPSKGHRYGVD